MILLRVYYTCIKRIIFPPDAYLAGVGTGRTSFR